VRDDVRGVLEAALGRRVEAVERRPHVYRTSFGLEELNVRLEDATELALVLKDLSRTALSDHGARAKPAFLHDPMREIEVYRSILANADFETPAFHGAIVDPSGDRYLLLIEKVPGLALWQVGELEAWEAAARWLARLHTTFARRSDELLRTAPLLRCERETYRLWLERARSFTSSPALERLAHRYNDVVDRVSSLPETFVHGEFYPSNILVVKRHDRWRIAPVDWEMAAVGPGLLDLAALTSGWAEEQRIGLVRAYRAELWAPLVPGDFDHALDCCRLHVAVQWLGWSPEWSPPPEHVRDWLGEVVALAERLGI
jgi:aminoglycoside phosphotransferase (APT) family kinase protein